jgi:hypothetical protein
MPTSVQIGETVFVFAPDESIEITETWRGQRWSTTRHVFVGAREDAFLVTYRAHGVDGTYVTSHGVPGRDHMSRSQRKMEALRTGRFRTVTVAADLHTLEFFEPGSWARVNLGWDEAWRFLGWYVNFEEPPRITPGRIDTMDLVLDAMVGPDRAWRWKDCEDYHQALTEALIGPQAHERINETAVQVQKRLNRQAGPFAEHWRAWRPACAGEG